MNIPKSLTELAKILSPLAPLYIVGGAVRDFLLGREYTDIDICSSATPDEVISLLHGTVYSCHDINKRLGTLQISAGDERYEYTTFRTESYTEKGEHTPSVTAFTDDIAKDCLRRDFTVNAIYYDVLSGSIVDLVGGVNDIRSQVIRTVCAPEITFFDDGLRLLRMVRLALDLGFDIDSATLDTARLNAKNLRAISRERIRAELIKIFGIDTKKAVKGAKLMQKCDFLCNIFGFSLSDTDFRYLSRASKTDKFITFFVDIFYASRLEIDEYIARVSDDLRLTKCEKTLLNKLLLGLSEMSRFDEKFVLKYYSISPYLIELSDKKYSDRLRETIADKVSQNAPFSISELDVCARDLITLGVPDAKISSVLDAVLLDAFTHPSHNSRDYILTHILKEIL